MNKFRAALVLAVGVAWSASSAASGPTFWTVATPAEFLRGTSVGASVSSTGVVTPGPAVTNRLRGSAPQIWSVAEAPDGTVWAGTGGDGRLLRFRPGQPEETMLDADEPNVFAVAISGSRVYAATSPDGRVYVIEGNNAARPFFDPSEKYIWALAVDSDGRLWIGAGNPAVIYRVDAAGTGSPIYRPPAAHTVVLTSDREGRMLAGTESPGRLYRIGTDGRAFALLDTGMTEVRGVTVAADGTVYAAALQRGDETAAGDAGTLSAAITLTSPAPTPAATASGSSSSSSSSARRSEIFRIDPNGTWESVWETTDVAYDVAALDDNAILIGTGPEGRLYRLGRANDVVLLTGVDARQITRFAPGARKGSRLPLFGTANPGRVLAPAPQDPSPATFVSAVRDSRSIATWGLIRWEATDAVQLFTRSGNTETPDDSWADWSGPYAARAGESIKSPAARFIQWKAVFPRTADNAARLTSVTVAYLPRNSRPVISSITIHPPGVVFQKPFSSEDGAIAGLDEAIADARRPPGEPQPAPPPGRRMFQRGLQTIVWRAEDADADRLSYTLQYRREGETDWRDLRQGLLDPIFVWDTTSVADGRYLVRVIASDVPTNAVERAMTGERDSDAITIDNSSPQITVDVTRTGATSRLAVRVRDAISPILKLEYSIGGGAWVLVYPADGLADSPDERYDIALPAGTDPTRVVVRATDQLQNVSVAAVSGR